MQKILIIGRGGAGKTTLANQLSDKLGIPYHEMDAMFWLPNWVMKDTQQFKTDVEAVLEQDTWIMCGGYIRRLEGLTLQHADTIIWLNYPPRIFLPRLIKRSMKRALTKEAIWGTNKEHFWRFWFSWEHSILWISIRNYYRGGRNSFRERVANHGQEHKIVEFRHPKEVTAWLNQL